MVTSTTIPQDRSKTLRSVISAASWPQEALLTTLLAFLLEFLEPVQNFLIFRRVALVPIGTSEVFQGHFCMRMAISKPPLENRRYCVK